MKLALMVAGGGGGNSEMKMKPGASLIYRQVSVLDLNSTITLLLMLFCQWMLYAAARNGVGLSLSRITHGRNELCQFPGPKQFP